MTNYLLAGGGTAGHVNPLLALADAIKAQAGEHNVWALGTAEGLESRLVPERGFQLLTVERLPMPRRINLYAITFPIRFNAAVEQVKRYITEHRIDVVVGFGGYASAPAYRAAKALKIPYVVHEANALAGYANKVGARSADAVAVTFANANLPNATQTGMPLRREIVELTKIDHRFEANQYFNLDAKLTTLLVTGGSLGARSINETIEKSRTLLDAAGVQIIHIVGERAGLEDISVGGYRRVSYCSRMELAIAAADFAVSRSGAATVAEFTAVGLPAVFIPYPVGNGEQRLNAAEVVASGGALMVDDKEFDVQFVAAILIPLLSNKKATVSMHEKSLAVGKVSGTTDLLKLVNGVL
jgi:UDP-N-acetylglucosamine--N-acetylmuramyl-(pentapeptide) pyrophosphoryl-undecaprenol N-acetylglucosamine transferase